MAEIKSESVADFIPESVAGLLRNQHSCRSITSMSGRRPATRKQPATYAVALADRSLMALAGL
jgi:hypothetical protein